MDLVSIIVPIYNVEKYLDRCINSLLSQTYKNIEIILVDDGSTDESGEICDKYESIPNITVIHQKNKGLSGARNTGIDLAKGEWVTFIDSDDFVSEDYVEYLLKLCIDYGVMVSQCGAVRGTEDVFPSEVVEVKNVKWKFCDLYTSPSRAYRTVAWGKLFKKNLFEGLRFPEGLINEDEDTIFKLMYMAKEAVITNKHMYYYYMSPVSILRSPKENVKFDFVTIFEERISFLKKHKEEKLIETTKKELCIRLMLSYFSAVKSHMPSSDLQKLRVLFIKYYKQICRCKFSIKETCALKLFYYMPNQFAFMENHCQVIKRSKYRREKR